MTGRASSYDHRFAGLPAAEQAAVEITPGIPQRTVTKGEVILDKTLTVTQNASDVLAIARAATAYGAVRVDDVLTVEVTHQDGSKITKSLDFSGGCIGWVTPAGPLNLSGVLEPGNNTVRFILRDGCGGLASADPMYIVPVTTKVSSLAILGSGCDLCAKNPTVSRGYPVNTATGNETKSVTDLQLAGPGTAFLLLRSYNSASDHVGALGRGWNHAYEGRLVVAEEGAKVTYVGIDGQQAGYTRAADGSYTPGTGVDAALKKLADGTFELQQPNHSVARFSADGLLKSLLDQSGVGLQLAHANGLLSTVTDAAGRVVRFSHNADGRLESIELPDGRSVGYSYTSGLLTGVRDVRGGNTVYAYDTGRLTRATDPLGRSVVNEYDTDGRVIKQTDPRGKITQYTYDPLLGTTTTRPDGGKWTDHYLGNVLIGTSDARGGHTSFGYDANLNLTSTTDPRGNTTTMTYDARGNMLTRTAPTPLSYVERWTYDASDNVLTSTDARGRVTSYTYDTANRVTKKLLPDSTSNLFTYTELGQSKTRTTGRGQIWTNNYDAAGNLTSIVSPLGNTTSLTYDVSGRLLSRTDPRGTVQGQPSEPYTTTYTYDPADQVTSVKQPDGSLTTTGYDAVGKVISEQVAAPDTTVLKSETFRYDAENRLLEVKNRDRVTLTLTYDNAGNKASSTDATGAKTTYLYDRVGRMSEMTTPRGNVAGAEPMAFTWDYQYDANGNKVREFPPTGGYEEFVYDVINRTSSRRSTLGYKTSYGYDGNGNIWTVTDHTGQVTNNTYDSVGRLASEALPGLQPTKYTYDADGARLSATSPSGASVTKWTYDADGRQITQTDPRGNVSGGTPADYTTTYGYDPAGNQLTIKDKLGRVTTKAYDGRNNLLSQKDPRGNTTAYAYDALQRLASVTSPVGAQTTYSYDDFGDLVERRNAKGAVTKYGYNLRGELTSTIDPLDRKQTFEYDPDGNVSEIIKARGYASGDLAAGTISQLYDARGLRTAVTTAAAASNSTFAYDTDGRMTSFQDITGTTTQTWNSLNQLTGVNHPQGNHVYTYAAFGGVASRTYPGGGKADYGYDADGRITSMAAYGQTTSFAYDVDDNLTSATYPAASGYVETRTYDRVGDISSIRSQKNGVSTPLSRYDYARDDVGNPTSIKRTRGTTVYDEAFEYDGANRLTKNCVEATSCASASKHITYGYDAVGNRESETRVGVANPGTITTAFDAADQIVTRTNQTGTVAQLTYNADGMVQNGREWDVLGRLTKLGGSTFTYDAMDLRRTVQSAAGTKKMSWDINNELPLLNVVWQTDNSYWRYRYTPDGMPMYVEHPFNAYPMSLMMHDNMGTVTDIVDNAGAGRWRYAYEPFGVRTSSEKLQTVAEDPQFGFTGAYLESTTGEYHLRARDYNLWGVFSAPDPVRPSIDDPYVSGYAYANQRPTVLRDPSGMTPEGLGDFWDAVQQGDTWKNLAVGMGGGALQLQEQLPGFQQINTASGLVFGLDASALYYGLTDSAFGVDGTETSTRVGEFLTPIPGGSGVMVCKAGARSLPAILESLLRSGALRTERGSVSLPGRLSGNTAGPYSNRLDNLSTHLTSRDLDAAKRELAGEVVARKADGTPWNHVHEVRDAQAGLMNIIERAKAKLRNPNIDPAERAALAGDLSRASKMLDRSEKFVPR